jgi:hypothetical protein
VKFHTDENVTDAVAQGLRQRGIDVTITHEVGLARASDEEQLAYALRESRVIVSHDADMLRLASVGTPHAGLAYCHVAKAPRNCGAIDAGGNARARRVSLDGDVVSPDG